MYKLFENTVVKIFPFRLKYTLTHFPSVSSNQSVSLSKGYESILPRIEISCAIFPGVPRRNCCKRWVWRPLSRMHSPRFDPIRTLACVCQITRDPTSLSSIALNFDLADRSPRCLSCYSVYRLRKERLKRFRVFGMVKRTNFFFFQIHSPYFVYILYYNKRILHRSNIF